MYCTKCKKEFEGNFCPNCDMKVSENPTPPAENSQQTKEQTHAHPLKKERGLNVGLFLKMIGIPILFCLVIGYVRVYTYTSSAWQGNNYPVEKVKALNSVLLKSKVKNIESIIPSVTNNDEVTLIAGEHEQTSYLILFDGNKVSKITSKYGTLYDDNSINEYYFYWENRSNLEFSVEAEVFVKKYLQSPSSAEFSLLGTCKREKDRVIITSSVTADNSLGVPVSQPYTAVIQQSMSKPDDYILTYLKLGDDVLVNK